MEPIGQGVKRLSVNGKSVSQMTVASDSLMDLCEVQVGLVLRRDLVGEKDFPAGIARVE